MRVALPILLFVSLLTSATHTSGQTDHRYITLEDLFLYHKFTPGTVTEPRSMKDGKHFAFNNSGIKIDVYDYENFERTECLFDARQHDNIDYFESFALDHQEKRILLSTDEEQIYRHSMRSSYFVYDPDENRLLPLSNSGKQQLAAFSPATNWIAFVRNNNIYLADPFKGIEKQITFDGVQNEIINGAPDWVYEEEFAFDRGFHWSSDGRRIAFYRFDERQVKEFNLTIYGHLYPELYKFKYPKAGEENAIVTIHVYDLETGNTIQLDTGEETDQYISRINWTEDPEVLSIIRLNRLQNHMEILHADAITGKSEVVYEESNKYYISESKDHTITYLPDRKHFILLSERDGYFHFYLYNFIKKQIRPITSGDYDVADFIDYDSRAGRLYYSSYELSCLEKHVFGINANGTGKVQISRDKGFNRVVFSDNFEYYLLYNTSFSSPEKVTLHNQNGDLIKVLEDNSRVKKNMLEYGFTPVEFFKVHTRSGQDLNAYMIKPPDFNPEKQYPLFIFVYGGPESKKVAENWDYRIGWFQLLAQKGYIVACIDNRGTDGRGESFRKSTYMQLGKYETIDQVEAANFLAGLDYIDESRIGIFGWSYGGYMTALCMTKGGGLYKIGIAVAPITNWRFYDTVYTERFLRTPQENPEGYDENSPINFADQLEGKLLLIHGTADDNVHFQNSAVFAEALVKANKQFEMQFYINRDHGINGGITNFHLYNRMTNFILENL